MLLLYFIKFCFVLCFYKKKGEKIIPENCV